MSLQRQNHSSSFPSCFRPASAAADTFKASPPPPQTVGKTNLTTSFYHTNLGLFSLTWSRTFLGCSIILNLYPSSHFSHSSPLSLPSLPSSYTLRFHLLIKPFLFWKKYGNKKLSTATTANLHVFWDISRAKFGPGPKPESEFYIIVVFDRDMILLVGDSTKEAYARNKAQALVSRREHLFSNKLYTTKASFAGKMREISIECRVNDDTELCFRVDNERVLQIKLLKWKFRGNEKIQVDGFSIQISWDVYNRLFDRDLNNEHAFFVFKFEDEDKGRVLKNGLLPRFRP
ncbi:deSI-like protein [Hibiscus syriacus]|uniref:DeSI-like protein n=1 Tax=Hibiscus syriacus TaxID=106335 RepID=A0A6A3D6N6_HIBSY|nr:uncharacterized protein LOC120207452 [Hibiscus syriacus]KAE8735051.1 deSI-like protein [Hibiscus syriacus]